MLLVKLATVVVANANLTCDPFRNPLARTKIVFQDLPERKGSEAARMQSRAPHCIVAKLRANQIEFSVHVRALKSRSCSALLRRDIRDQLAQHRASLDIGPIRALDFIEKIRFAQSSIDIILINPATVNQCEQLPAPAKLSKLF